MAEVRVIVANIEKIKCEPEDVLGEILIRRSLGSISGERMPCRSCCVEFF